MNPPDDNDEAVQRFSHPLLVERSEPLRDSKPLDELAFELRTVWRDTMPSPTGAGNVLRYHTSAMHGDCDERTNYFSSTVVTGRQATRSNVGGRHLVENETEGLSEGVLGVHSTPPAPHLSLLATVGVGSDTVDGTESTAGVGLVKDRENWVGLDCRVDTGELAVAVSLAGAVERTSLGAAESTPVTLLATFAGNSLYAFTSGEEPGWRYHGEANWDAVDLYESRELRRWEPGLRYELDSGRNVAYDGFRVVQTPGVGIRDPTVVTYRDGAPFVNDGYVYFLATCGIDTVPTSYQGVFRMDTRTYDVEFTGTLFAESRDGYAYPDHAAHAFYDPSTDEFCVLFSGFGTERHGSASEVWTYVARTRKDILHGCHVLPVCRADLPGPGGHRDPFVVYDAHSNAWRCFHEYDDYRAVGVSETTDDSLVDGWEPVATRRGDETEARLEGCKITRVGGEYVLTYRDTSASHGLVAAEYPDPSKFCELTVDTPPSGGTPHPMVIPVPDGTQTKYLMLAMDRTRAFDLGLHSYGTLFVYEATHRAEGHEFPARTLIR